MPVCRTCVAGKGHLCLKMNFYGSAAVYPHIQGVFREVIVATKRSAFRCRRAAISASAAMAEPLAVALHAVRPRGLAGRQVSAGHWRWAHRQPSVLAARRAGGGASSSPTGRRCPEARRGAGIDDAVNAFSAPERVEAWYANKGTFDVTFECSGNAVMMSTRHSRPPPRADVWFRWA